jgi:hypothetical protein
MLKVIPVILQYVVSRKMTAEIAISNTHEVALAADSAIRINVGENEQKIYNSANKILVVIHKV